MNLALLPNSHMTNLRPLSTPPPFFLQPHLWHMEAPRLEVKSELQLRFKP